MKKIEIKYVVYKLVNTDNGYGYVLCDIHFFKNKVENKFDSEQDAINAIQQENDQRPEKLLIIKKIFNKK